MTGKLDSRLEKQPYISSNNFLKKYLRALVAVADTIRNDKPDIIVALSRKAPRLLEVLTLIGILHPNVTVISERALDFMPPSELEGKKVLVFDDIIISGTSIHDVLSHLTEKYVAQWRFLCVAVDADTIALPKNAGGDYYVKCRNGTIVTVDTKVRIERDERFIFCHEIVRLFAILNKPYDIDYPIFNISADYYRLSMLLDSGGMDRVYNLTTLHQYNCGFYRHTFIPLSSELTRDFCSHVLSGMALNSQICKVRSYINRNTLETALVPIVTFEIGSDALKSDRIFSDKHKYMNQLLCEATCLTDDDTRNQAMYRLLWYIVSYIYGLSYIMRHPSFTRKYESVIPSKMLKYVDLLYLFGPKLSKIIINYFDSHYGATISSVRAVGREMPDVSKGNPPDTTERIAADFLDEERSAAFKSIRPYMELNTRPYAPLSDRIATIFEALYYCVEIPTQEHVKKTGIQGHEHRRLGTGFNHQQLRTIIELQSSESKHVPDLDLQMSLSFDFLVDAGIMIPIFYYGRRDGCYERAYRYGEDALSARQFGYLIATTLESLFQHMKSQDNIDVLPAITLEKMGVIFQEEIQKQDVLDILKGMTDEKDRRLILTPFFSRHGKVLHINDEAYEETSRHPYLFSDWTRQEGITTSVKNGAVYSSAYLDRFKFPSNYMPKLIASEKTARFRSLGILLYSIDAKVDKTGNRDYLVALTACADHETYLRSLREELVLFFKSKFYSFHVPLQKCIACMTDLKKLKETDIPDLLTDLSVKSYSAAHEVRHKRRLRDEINVITGNIEAFFSGAEQWLTIMYEQNLKVYIDRIKVARGLPEYDGIKQLRTELELFGELCISLSTILRRLLLLVKRVSLGLRVTRSGQVHGADLKAAENRYLSFKESIQSWDALVRKNPNTRISDVDLGCLVIGDGAWNAGLTYDLEGCSVLMRMIIPQIQQIYTKMEAHFNGSFSNQQFERTMSQLFPKGDSVEYEGIVKSIEAAQKCRSEDHKVRPKVGAVIIKDNKVICIAHRGEEGPGDHAEFTALAKKCENLDLGGATLITTLEPCIKRDIGKRPCALRIIERGIKKVIIGTLDPNPDIRGKGVLYLQRHNVEIEFFPAELSKQVITLNKEFWDAEWSKYKIELMEAQGDTLNTIENDFFEPLMQDSQEIPRIRIFKTMMDSLTTEELRAVSDSVYKRMGLSIYPEYYEVTSKSSIIIDLMKSSEQKRAIAWLLDALEELGPIAYRRITDPEP